MSGKTEDRLIGENELLLSRVFDAPRELVFKAWTDPKMFAAWWAPKDFTNPVVELDVRPGGLYHVVMRGPDGQDYPCDGNFIEIVPPERIVMTDSVIEHPDAWFDKLNAFRGAPPDDKSISILFTITFEDLGNNRTRLNIMHRFHSAADREGIINMGHVQGFSESLDKLDALLTRQ